MPGSQLHKPGSQFETVNLSDHQGLRGLAKFGGTTTAVFLGIPFALPPLDLDLKCTCENGCIHVNDNNLISPGERRYRKPEAMYAWTGIRDALDLSPACLQIPYGQSTMQGAEDCLYLNVFTPSTTTNGSLPVMVWIHGGGFAFGSGIYWDGTRLAGEGGVVVVTFNYRLEALGFASTGDDVMPGNYGMLDQVLALQWVQSHIHAFGGDPRRVTVFGNSAGSASISLHLLSPLSVGLFHQAIMESGSSFSLWGVERKRALTSLKEATMTIAKNVGCPTDNEKENSNSKLVLECLRKANGHAIIKQSRLLAASTNTLFIFMPRVETTFNFLPDYPEVLFDAGQFQNVDTISGFTSGEAALVINSKFPNATGISRSQFKEGLLRVFTWCSFSEERQIVEWMTDVYLHDITDPKLILAQFHQAANDLFKMPVLLQLHKILKYQNISLSRSNHHNLSRPKHQNFSRSNHQTLPKATTHRHHLYQFDYIPSTIQLPRELGLPHSQERALVFYSVANTAMFTNDNLSMDLSPEDVKMANKVQTVWTNFAKSGIPLGDTEDGSRPGAWPGYTFDSSLMAHLDIDFHLLRYVRQSQLALYEKFIKFVNRC